jgi:hypothetical protein
MLACQSVDQSRSWCSAIKHASRPAPPPRSGKELWQYLRPQLKLIVEIQRQWGDLRMIYSKPASIFEAQALPWSIRDPESNFSIAWDAVQLLLLIYVAVVVPLRACFDLEPCFADPIFFFESCIDTYFIVDLVRLLYESIVD